MKFKLGDRVFDRAWPDESSGTVVLVDEEANPERGETPYTVRWDDPPMEEGMFTSDLEFESAREVR